MPDGRERRFSARTLWTWWSAYRQYGLDGLLPKRRQDRGTLRALSPEVLAAAIALRREVPSRSTATLIDILATAGRVGRGQLHRATLDRHLGHAGVTRRRLRTLGDKRYIRLLFERPNQFWVGDYHEAPLLWEPARERYRTLHLCAVIDHFSKLVPHAEWYATEQIATLEACLKQAILKRGLPEALYVDNGAAYRADQFSFACAHLGIRLRHSTPYASEGRGAIERWNRTVVEQFEPRSAPCGSTTTARSSSASKPGWSSATTSRSTRPPARPRSIALPSPTSRRAIPIPWSSPRPSGCAFAARCIRRRSPSRSTASRSSSSRICAAAGSRCITIRT